MRLKLRGRHLGFFQFRFGCTVSTLVPLDCSTPKNMGVAVRISLVSCLEAEIHAFEVERPPYWVFPLPVRSHSIPISLIGKLNPKT